MSEKVKLEGLRDRLHRGVKLLIDSKDISSLKEAYQLLESYRITCVVGPEITTSPTLQAALSDPAGFASFGPTPRAFDEIQRGRDAL